MAWHCGNSWGNGNLLGYEACQSMGASDAEFLANEEMTLKQMAEDFKFYGITPNRNTVYLHRALSSTSCPHRSWAIHVGYGAPDTEANRNKLVDHFVSRIKFYMGNASATPSAPKPTPAPTPAPTGERLFKVGDTVTVANHAKYYQTGQRVASFVKGNSYKIIQVKDVNQSKSKVAYLLEGIMSWVLEQDVVNGRGSTAIGGGGAPTVAKPTIKQGSKVKVVNPVSYDGVRLATSGTYDVMELKGDRAVIGRGGVVTSAINVRNLALA